MRTMTAIALCLATLTSTVDAKPRARRPHATARDSKWVRECIHERTGPDGGISVAEARKACRAEEPEDLVAAAKSELTLARANAKVAKAKARVAKAIEACEQAIVDRCVATAAPDGSTDCMDSALWPEFQLVCGERGPRPEGGQ